MASSIVIKPTGRWRFSIVRRPWLFGKLYPEWHFEFDEPLTAPPPGVTFSYLFPATPGPALPDGASSSHNSPESPAPSKE